MSARHLLRLTTEEHAALVNMLAIVVELDSGDFSRPETHATLARVLKKAKGAPCTKRSKKKRKPATTAPP